jgi:tetratricopeptide (TPR) repeat protein
MELKLNVSDKIPSLCLNMIVKNESKIITRLFDSVINIIDCYCICDTGSDDNTIEIIQNYFREKGVPGKIIQEPFQNFCHNRNFALQSCIGMSDFILLLDADMILDNKTFDKNVLNTADAFHLFQGSESFYYYNVRIIRNNGLFLYTGVTHEIINYPNNTLLKTLDKEVIFIKDYGDGGCKSNKYERDIKLLTDGINKEPLNDRYHFYLANSYYDTGKYNEAIEFYKKRIELGGWKEEIWYSYYRIGLSYMKLNKMSEALWHWFEGYNFYPERFEGLYEIIKFYRLNGKNKLAFSIYNMCKDYLEKNINRDEFLFLHKNVYKYNLYYEYSIVAFYNDVKNINDEVIKILNSDYNYEEGKQLLKNLTYYKDILQADVKYNHDNSISSSINGELVTFNSSSSCLLRNKDNNGYKMNIRYVNYKINEKGHYFNCDNHIITVNRLLNLDNNLNIISSDFFELEFDNRRYIGIEDVRIIYDQYKNKIVYTGTGYHKNDKIGVVYGDYNIDSKTMSKTELTQTFKNTNCEKNWVLFNYKDDLHFVYEWHPLTICKLNNDNIISVVETKPMPKIFSIIRGSTCGFEFKKMLWEDSNHNIKILIEDNEIWFVGHIVSYEEPRNYYHIIYVFDNKMKLLRYSAPFKFEGEPIEYCLSIIVDDDKVLMNYSTWDRTTRIGVYNKRYIESLLKYN